MRLLKILIFLLSLSIFGSHTALCGSMKQEIEEKYGNNTIDNLNKLQNPGRLYPGVRQDNNESEDPSASKTKEITKSAAGSKIDYQMVEEAIKAQREAMKKWGKKNKDMEVLEPLRCLTSSPP